MIQKIVNHPKELLTQFTRQADPIASWIAGQWEEENSLGRELDLWAYFDKETPLLLLMKWGDEATISTIPGSEIDYSEVVSFLGKSSSQTGIIWGVGGVAGAVSEIWSQLTSMGYISSKKKQGKAMTFEKNKLLTPSTEVVFHTTETLDYEKLYALLKESGMESVVSAESQMAWHTNLSHSIRHGFEKVAVIEQEGKYVSAGILEEKWYGISFLSSITTSRSYRKQGLARKIVATLTAESLKDNRTPFLFALGEDSARLYESIGYQAVGEWLDISYQYNRKDGENL